MTFSVLPVLSSPIFSFPIFSSPWRLAARVGVILAVLATLLGAGVPRAEAAPRYLRVSGLAPGRVLWLRAGPGRSFRRIGVIRHNARRLRRYRCRRLATGSWCEVGSRGTRGWASARYLRSDRLRKV